MGRERPRGWKGESMRSLLRRPPHGRGGTGERATARLRIGLGLATLALVAAGPTALATFAAADRPAAVELSKHERALVIQAEAKGESSVTLMFASQDKANG